VIEITAIRVVRGYGHEHITDVMWRSAATSTGLSTVEGIIGWLSANANNQAVVADPLGVEVAVVRPAGQPPHLCARADGKWTDDLLALPRF
jgi:hypothetical protein